MDPGFPRIDFGSLIDRPLGVTLPIPEEAGQIPGQALVHLTTYGLQPAEWLADLGKIYARLDLESHRSGLAYAGSAVIHQLRHFHDLRLTPWGKRVSAAIASVEAAFAEVSRALASETSFNVPLAGGSVPLPAALEGPVRELAVCVERAYGLAGRSPSYSDSTLEVRHLFEAAAMSVHEECFTRAFGTERAAAFAREISHRTDAEAHTRCRAHLVSVADQIDPSRRFDPAAANAVLFWSLCADPEDSTEMNHPVDRFHGAMAYFLHERKLPDAGNVFAMLDRLSRMFDVPPLEASLPPVVLGNPLDYFDPWSYLECADRWPAAPVWVTMPASLGGPAFAQTLQDSGWRAFGISGEQVLVLSPITSDGVPETTSDEAGRASILIWMAVALVSGDRLEPVLRAAALAGLKGRFPKASIH